MAQHFLLSPAARNFAAFVDDLTEEAAEQLLSEIRWGSQDKQVCPRCGVFRKHYRRVKRRRWRCAETKCGHEFSVTSGTMFDRHKLPLRRIVRICLAIEAGAKGISTLAVSKLRGASPKTCLALAGKVRESLVKSMDLRPLKGIVHIDGAYFCGKPRKPNRRMKISADAIAKRHGKKKIKNENRPWIEAGMTRSNWMRRADKRVVISACEASSSGKGSSRTVAFVCRSENSEDIAKIAAKFISPDAIIMSDENPAYNILDARYEHHVVSHSREFSTSEGVNNNMAETFNSRLRRGEYGSFHGFRPRYLQDYSCEFAWRETKRRTSQRDRIVEILSGLLTRGISQWWRGYWQGQCRGHEIGLDYFLA